MSRVVNIQSAITINPSSYDRNDYSYASMGGANSGYTNASSTNYATINLKTGNSAETYVYWNFDTSAIPSNATINSVSCAAKIYISTTNSSRVQTRQAQLYAGTTAKGTAYTVTNSTTSFSITPGTWSLSELQNARLRIYAKRGTSNTGSTYYFRFYGADLTVNYSISGTEYEVTATSEVQETTISPSTQAIFQGSDASVRIDTDDLNNIIVEDNGNDVTEQVQYVTPTPDTISFTGIPTSYDSENSFYDSIYTGSTSDGLASNTSSSRICAYVEQTAYAEAKLTYNFDCSSIPRNATITGVTCIAAAACYSNGQYFDSRTIQLYNGSIAKGSAVTITGNGNTSTNHTVNGGSWTREELDNIKIVIAVTRGNNTTQASFSFWGATLTVQYTLPTTPYYQYTITNINTDHEVVVRENVIVPPEEDPQKTYYSLTISSINATTEPGRGTTRVESGDSQTIIIRPSDPLVTLIRDNGVDVSGQLVYHSGTSSPTYSVSTAQGASYGFNLNTSTGYYVSTNAGVSKTASVCRIDFDLPSTCIVTFQFINYAEATYDFGVFGNIDTSLSNDYYAAGSNGATITDSSYKLACNTSTYNTSSVQTLSYEIPQGQHYIYIKYSKDDATDNNNDSLQWKISDIQATSALEDAYYEYTLANINENHSLIFIFGDVTYYFITSSCEGDSKLYPDGEMVCLTGSTYKLTVVPEESDAIVTVSDNNLDVTNNLERKEIVTEKYGESALTVNYIYSLTNIQTGHTILVTTTPNEADYIKCDNTFKKVISYYEKIAGAWSVITMSTFREMASESIMIYGGNISGSTE